MADNTSASSANSQAIEIDGKVQEEESHLSETARFVLPFLRKITTRLRDKGLIARGNEIIRKLLNGEITAEDPMVIDYILDCGDQKEDIIQELIQQNAGTKAEAVVRNFFSKFLNREIKKLSE